MDGRIVVLIIPVLILWAMRVPSHYANPSVGRRIRIGRALALLGGSRSAHVNAYAFGWQLGNLSIIVWYVGLWMSGENYWQQNAYVFSILLGTATGWIAQKVLQKVAQTR
ncbi:MAG TPA: hypothetical protein P5121_33750 [Caldilineaceae bacterium]|nr:hypothetical protein [Caldilineaceae bacterium]